VPLLSLMIIEAPGPGLLRCMGEHRHYRAFREMTDTYLDAFQSGKEAAIATMIDFYGGAGTFNSWPQRVRDYAVEMTPVNLLDWTAACGFQPAGASLASIAVPTLVLWGAKSHPAVICANARLAQCMARASLVTIEEAAHFMIATHPKEVARVIGQHVDRAESMWNSQHSNRSTHEACSLIV
jgi:pimeloyl-ACP methyl ester carboxylesterase